MDTTKLTNEAYTIGWICALEVELAAAQALLDEEHPDLPLQLGDSNVYTLGRFGSHNVAIACLPRGGPGIGSAAVAATNLLRSFPNIRFSLMVGVGGGVPDNGQSDVRLGDIVVSTPVGIYGGVIQYDMGKAIQDSPFLRTGSLNRPPDILSAAVAKSSARMRLKGSRAIRELVDNAAETYPEAGFIYPGSEHDILFRSDCLHEERQDTCVQCDKTAIVDREPRLKPGYPAIHYGLIGSANQVLRDAKVRDDLGKIGILCIEMEAAGLMNSFPCLVIRGICDYCDSHKKKNWQPYAAAVASAYAKELLANVAAVQVAQIELAWEVINKKVEHTANLVDKLAAKQDKIDVQAILNWLAPIDFAGIQQNHVRQRFSNTGKWLLNSSEFETWINGKKATLFLHGIPGAGKTILSSMVVQFIQEECSNEANHGLCYIYLDYSRRADHNLSSFYASFLRQLLQYVPDIPEEIGELHAKYDKTNQRPDLDALRNAIRMILAGLTQTYFVVDALDECQEPRSTVIDFISELFDLQLTYNINIIATSRQIPEIVAMFEHYPMLEVRARDDDIERYIDGSIKNFPAFVVRNEDLIDDIKTEIIKSAGGMFLLAKLHTESLYGKRTARELRKALANLGKGEGAYTEAYTQTMHRVCGQIEEQRDLALLVLTYVVYAKMPLSISALLHAVAITIDETGIHEDGIPEQDNTISACCGLVTVEGKNKLVRLVHLTTQEFFTGSGVDWLKDPQTVFTSTCIRYLSLEDFINGACGDHSILNKRLDQFPFYYYASWFWGHHAAASDNYTTIVQELLEKNQHVEAMIEVYESFIGLDRYRLSKTLLKRYEKEALPVGKSVELHLLSVFGLIEMIPHFLRIRDVNAVDGRQYSPILYAIIHGQIDTVQLLIDHGAHLEQERIITQDDFNRTALIVAIRHNNQAIVDLLLNHDVDCRSRDKDGRTLLSYAAEYDSLDGIRLLKDKGAKCDDPDSNGRTPLSYAAKKNNRPVARLLLSEGATIDSRDKQGRTPLSWATTAPGSDTLSLLLDIGKQDGSSKARNHIPVLYAKQKNDSVPAKISLSSPSSIPLVTDNQGMNLLHLAAKYSESSVMKVLLERGDGSNCAFTFDKAGKSSLRYAIERSHDELVRMLLVYHQKEYENSIEDGASASAKLCTACHEPISQTETLPILLAEDKFHRHSRGLESLMALLDVGCHYATRKQVRTALMGLISARRRDKIKMLLEKSARIDDPDVMDDLHSSIHSDRVENDNDTDRKLWIRAVYKGPHYVKLLLEHSRGFCSEKSAVEDAQPTNDGHRLDPTERKELWRQAFELTTKYYGKVTS